MKEVCILSNGDSLEKIQYEYNNIKSIVKLDNKVWGYNAVQLNEGSDDIVIVRNYNPLYVYTLKKDETILDVIARGFDCGGVYIAEENDTIVITKPRSIRYVVKPLETIDDISYKIGVKKEDIMEINNLISEKLFVGQILWI